MKRCKRLFNARLIALAARSLRTCAVAGVLIVGMAETESRAEITLDSRDGQAIAFGALRAGPPTETNGYDVLVPAPPGFGPFTLQASPPPGTTSIAGASAIANGQVNANITLDIVADTLFVSSAASASASVSGTQTPTRFTTARAGTYESFFPFFSTDSSYDYEFIIGALSAGAQAAPGRNGFAESHIFLRTLGGGDVFVRSRFFPFNSRTESTVGPDVGSLVGTLVPGDYLLQSSAGADIDNFVGTSANADYQFTLRLTPSGTVRWVNATGGSFGDTQNWSPQRVPEKSVTRDDTALFDLNNNYAVDIDSQRTIERLVVHDGRVDFNNNILTVAALSPTEPSVSIENDGRLNIATGGLRSVHAIIGNAPPVDPANPPTAEVLVANVNQGWQLTGNLAVGGAGKGRLFVANGGLVGSASSTIGGPFGGEAIVGGHSSRWQTGNLAVGSGGNGSLTVEAGGEVDSGLVNVVGFTAGSRGEVTVTGIDATDGSSSSWTTSLLTVGGSGAEGFLNILDGGVVSTGSLIVVNGPGSVGRVVVSGRNAGGIFPESRLLAQGIIVGGNGDLALMSVTNGGAVSCNLSLEISDGGSLEIVGPTSLVDVTGDATVGNNGAGSISFNGGRMVVGGTLTVGPGGELSGNGTLIAPNRSVSIGGVIDPGLSPGILTFDADFEQTGTALLHIEIAGTAPGLFDLLEITGDATLDGTLLLEFIDGFAPRQGDEFKFLDIGGALGGAFASVEVRNLAPGFQFDLRPDAGGLTMVALNDGVFVPEPATLAMLFAGMLATLFRRGGAGPVAQSA